MTKAYSLGDRIEDLRSNRKMTQKELADKVGCDVSNICRIESGKTTEIKRKIAVGLAGALKTSTDYIYGLTDISIPELSEQNLGLTADTVNRVVVDPGIRDLMGYMMGHPYFMRLLILMEFYGSETVQKLDSLNECMIEPVWSLYEYISDDLESEVYPEIGDILINSQSVSTVVLKQIFATLRKILNDYREAGIQKTNEIRPKIISGEITV